MTIAGVVASAAASSAPPTPAGLVASDYDGTKYQSRADLVGMADSKKFLYSGWWRIDGGDGARRALLSNGTNPGAGNNKVEIGLLASNKFAVIMKNAAGATILQKITTQTYLASSAWHHVIISADLATAAWMRIDGALVALDSNTRVDDTIDFVGGGGLWQAAGFAGATLWDGCVSEEFFHEGIFLADTAPNNLLFRSTENRPVYLGADGSVPLGVQPRIYGPTGDLSGAGNKGSGGAFNNNGGAPTVCSTAPGSVDNWVLRPTPGSLVDDEQGPVIPGTGNLLVSPGNNFNAGRHPITQVSTDGGLTFTRHDHFGTVGAAQLVCGAFGDGVFVLGALGIGSNAQGLFTTPDGVTLTRVGPSANYGVFGVAHNGQSGAASRFMAVGGNSTFGNRFVQISADNGATWTSVLTATIDHDPWAIAHNQQPGAAGRWAMIDDRNRLWVSANDGVTWTAQAVGDASGFYGIAHNGLAAPNGLFMVTAESNAAFNAGSRVVIADNAAASWSVVVLPFAGGDVGYPSGVAYGENEWLVTFEGFFGTPVGYSFATSPDGAVWTGRNDATFDSTLIPPQGVPYCQLGFGLSYGVGKFFMGRSNSADVNGDDMIASYS